MKIKNEAELVNAVAGVDNQAVMTAEQKKIAEQQARMAEELDAREKMLAQAYAKLTDMMGQMGCSQLKFRDTDEFQSVFQAAIKNYRTSIKIEAREEAAAEIQIVCQGFEQAKNNYIDAKKVYESRNAALSELPDMYKVWAETTFVSSMPADGKPEVHTIACFWRRYVQQLQRSLAKTPEEKALTLEADKNLGE